MLVKVKGVLIEEVVYRSGESKKSGKEWEMATLVIEDEFECKYAFSCFGSMFTKVRDYELKVGSILDCVIEVKSKAYEDRWFTNLGLDSFEFVGMDTSGDIEEVDNGFNTDEFIGDSALDISIDSIDDNLPF